MLKPTLSVLAAMALLASAGTNRSEALIAKPPVKKAAVEMKLTAKTDTYTIDCGDKTPVEYAKWLKDLKDNAKKGADVKMPNAPAVDLAIEFTNSTKEKTTIYVGGDYTLELKLEGPGAFTIPFQAAHSGDIKRPTAIELEPGKSHTIPLTKLEAGFRGYGVKLYWAEPGDYTLTAVYSTGNNGGEKGEANTFTSAPLKLKVKEGKKPNKLPPDKVDPVEPAPPIRILPAPPVRPIRPVPPIQIDPNNPPPIQIDPVPPARPFRPRPPVEEPKDKEPAKKGPLEFSFEAKKDGESYKLDKKAAAELKKELEAAKEDAKNGKMRDKIPAAPAVELNLVIKNTSDKDVDIYVGGDDSRLSLELKGTGAMAGNYLVFQTADFRMSKKVTLEPGKTYTHSLKSLEWGSRGVGNRWYWTEAGDYELTATYQLGAPEGKQGPKLTTPALKIKIEEAK